MPSSATVHDQLVRIIVQVVGCEPEAVVQSARLNKDLGVDSLSIVEVAEKLGEAFGIYLRDDVVNSMVTVQDGIDAVTHHDPADKGPAHPAVAQSATATLRSAFRGGRRLPVAEIQRRKRIAKKFAWAFAGAGLALGLILGLGGTALINATGMKDIARPATAKPTASATASHPPKTTPTPTTTTTSQIPPPTLEAASTSISPGEKLRLTGAFPELGKGATIQVQVKDVGAGWDDFPVMTRTGDGGTFTTIIFTTRTGERQFRLYDKATKTSTPAITVTIG